MNTARKAAGHFMLWLFLGLAAGVFLAAVLSYREYQVLQARSWRRIRWQRD